MKNLFCLYFFLIIHSMAFSNDGYPCNNNADVLHYNFELTIYDSTNSIDGRALIKIRFVDKTSSLSFDLTGINSEGKGMQVKNVMISRETAEWKHESESLKIIFNNAANQDDTLDVMIEYSGVPADGLIISENKFGKRTFFADHWPNRAHNYLPCIDHPYDKAAVDFIITAPDRYKVIASGILMEESDLPGPLTLTHWRESIPLRLELQLLQNN